MYKIFTLSLIFTLFSYSVAISQTVKDSVITNPPDSIAITKTTDSIVIPIVKIYEMKPGTFQPGSDTIAIKRNQQIINSNDSKENNKETKQKNSTHAPDVNDPNYAAKFDEWKKNYPEEFNNLMKPITDTNIINQLKEQAAKDAKQIPPVTVSTTDTFKVVPKDNPNDLPQATVNQISRVPQPINPDTLQNKTTPNNVVGLQIKDTVTQSKDTVVKNMGAHAPAFDDPDYEAKKDKWIKDFPEEYKQYLPPQNDITNSSDNVNNNAPPLTHSDSLLIQMKQQIIKQRVIDSLLNLSKIAEAPKLKKINDSIQALKSDSIRNTVVIPQRMTENSPIYTDPDYASKKEEWIRKFPDEYNKQLIVTDEQKQKQLEELIESNPSQYDTQLQNFRISDPKFFQQHLEWLKTNDPERYKFWK